MSSINNEVEKVGLDAVGARVDKLREETAGEDSAEVVPTPDVKMEGLAPVDGAVAEEELLKVAGVEGDRKPDDRSQRLFAEVLPLIQKQMGTANILECRRVTRAWKDAVDLAYQTDPRQMEILAPKHPHKWHILPAANPASSLSTIFSTPEQVHEFLQVMESHPGNPFPGRNLLLHPTSDEFEDFLEFWDSVTRVLELFGNHVHFFRVDFMPVWEYEVLELTHQRILLRCLTYQPNLRSLAVTIQNEAFPNREDLACLTEHALPQMPQLETLMVSCIPSDLTALILASCCVPHKIRRLFLGEFRSSDRGYYEEVLGFQNLEVIHDKFYLPELERFSNLAQLPPLTEIWLYGQSGEDQRVLTLLERFGATLKTLAVTGSPLGLRMNAGYDFRVNLPQLRRLVLWQYLGPLDPFLELSALTELTMVSTVRPNPEPWEGSAVNVVGIADQLQNSNLWSLMPSLQKLIIVGIDYIHFYKRNSENGSIEKLF